MAFSPPSYAVNDEGGTFIAASQRPDGTWRKPRRVKDGYVPQEEVPLYESKGRQFSKSAPQYPVGLDPALIRAAEARKDKAAKLPPTKISPIPGLVLDVNDSKNKKKKKTKSSTSTDEVTNSLAKVKVSQKDTSQKGNKSSSKSPATKTKGNQKETSTKEPESTPADPAKRIKNLRKRLREIEAIEQKIASGELKSLEKDQLDKVARKNEILQEINDMESIVQPLTSV